MSTSFLWLLYLGVGGTNKQKTAWFSLFLTWGSNLTSYHFAPEHLPALGSEEAKFAPTSGLCHWAISLGWHGPFLLFAWLVPSSLLVQVLKCGLSVKLCWTFLLLAGSLCLRLLTITLLYFFILKLLCKRLMWYRQHHLMSAGIRRQGMSLLFSQPLWKPLSFILPFTGWT